MYKAIHNSFQFLRNPQKTRFQKIDSIFLKWDNGQTVQNEKKNTLNCQKNQLKRLIKRRAMIMRKKVGSIRSIAAIYGLLKTNLARYINGKTKKVGRGRPIYISPEIDVLVLALESLAFLFFLNVRLLNQIQTLISRERKGVD